MIDLLMDNYQVSMCVGQWLGSPSHLIPFPIIQAAVVITLLPTTQHSHTLHGGGDQAGHGTSLAAQQPQW